MSAEPPDTTGEADPAQRDGRLRVRSGDGSVGRPAASTATATGAALRRRNRLSGAVPGQLRRCRTPQIERKQRAADDDPALIELATVRFEEVRSALEGPASLVGARGGDRSRLGEDRLQECVQSCISEAGGPEEIIESLIRLIDEFQVGPAADDVTIVALTRSGGGDDGARGARGDASGDASSDATGDAHPPETDARSTSGSSLGAR